MKQSTNWFRGIALGLGVLLVGCGTTHTELRSAVDSPRIQKHVASEAGFLVTSNLISGKDEAILIDAQFTRSEARRVVALIKQSGKKLKTVFITHGHPDHYFGAEIIAQAFPAARIVASTETIADIKETGEAALKQWKPIYKDDLTDSVPTVDRVTQKDLTLDGEEFLLRSALPGESHHASIIIVPSARGSFCWRYCL